MFRKIAIFSLIIPWLLFSGCASRPADERPTIFVSILPLRGIVSEIVGDDFRVEVLVPPGMNPESFEPTPPADDRSESFAVDIQYRLDRFRAEYAVQDRGPSKSNRPASWYRADCGQLLPCGRGERAPTRRRSPHLDLSARIAHYGR